MNTKAICRWDVETVNADESTRVAAQRMRDRNVGTLVVVDGEQAPVGILTERDVVHRVPVERSGRGSGHVTLAEVMSAPPGTVDRRASLAEAIGLMARRRFRHLVVTGRNGELRGLLTAADVVQYVTDQFPEETVNLPPRLHQTFARPEGG